jgi:hypothetical protein
MAQRKKGDGGRRDDSGMKSMILGVRRREFWCEYTQLMKIADWGGNWLAMEGISANQNA